VAAVRNGRAHFGFVCSLRWGISISAASANHTRSEGREAHEQHDDEPTTTFIAPRHHDWTTREPAISGCQGTCIWESQHRPQAGALGLSENPSLVLVRGSPSIVKTVAVLECEHIDSRPPLSRNAKEEKP
jgi:hypothetical protein